MDLDAPTAYRGVPREFLAVILAGFGNELSPLTSDHGEEPCPKALLPVANKPMINYTLTWVEQSGIKDVLLICPTSHLPAISHHINSDTSQSTSLRIDIQAYDESQDDGIGTCTILRSFSNRILSDFVILPCDFIPPPSLPLTSLLNKFRTDSIADGAIATTCWFESQRPGEKSSPEDWGLLPPPMPIVWDEPTGTLLHIDTPDDLDRDAEAMDLRMSLLSRYPRTKMSSNYQDSHVYVCRRSVLDALQEKRHLDSFREEFIPWLCKVQYQRTRREKYGRVLNPPTNASSQAAALKHSTLRTPSEHYPLNRSLSSLKRQLHTQSTTSLHAGANTDFDPEIVPESPRESDDADVDADDSLPSTDADEASLRIGIVLHRSDSTHEFASRVNTLHSLLEMNRRLLSQMPTSYVLPTDPTERALIDQKAQISSDSMIGSSTKVDERTNIKKSIIGKHCIIGKMAKISGCVLLDHCVVEDGAKLDGCILGKNTKVGAKAELVRCVTQAGYEVDAGESYKNEKLDVSDWTQGGPDEDDSDEESSEDDEEDESTEEEE